LAWKRKILLKLFNLIIFLYNDIKFKLWDILKNIEVEEKLAPKKEEQEKEIRKDNYF